jgi:hypothetical protein
MSLPPPEEEKAAPRLEGPALGAPTADELDPALEDLR